MTNRSKIIITKIKFSFNCKSIPDEYYVDISYDICYGHIYVNEHKQKPYLY